LIQRGPVCRAVLFDLEREAMNFDPNNFDFGSRTPKQVAKAADDVAEAMKQFTGKTDVEPDHIVGMLALVAVAYQTYSGPGADSLHAIIHNCGVCWNMMLEHQGFIKPEDIDADDDDDDDDDFLNRFNFSQN
jgi:hypothetical protein